MIKDTANYEDRLTTIANTRLIYNTMDELEEMLDNHSIHNNGIKRCFASQQKMRSAYRDLKVEVEYMTDWLIDLDMVMLHYQRAWEFFRDNLYRRSKPEQVAIELLSFCYPPYINRNIGAKHAAIYRQILDDEISIPFLLLMLTKSIPGYDSKEGDVNDIAAQFECVMSLLQKFIGNNTTFSVLPAIIHAREEENKSRIMLLYHVSKILDTYEAYANPANIYDTANDIKAKYVYLDIEGYWNECGGGLDYTYFWQIEDTIDEGCYFMTRWQKDSDNRLTGIRYALFIVENTDGGLIYYMLHPNAIKRLMNRQVNEDADQVWYKTEWLDETPDELPLQRLMRSASWQQNIHLTRCTDEAVISRYDRWLTKECEIVRPFQHLEYDLTPNLYAVTQTHLYIPSENEGEYYKIPRTAYEGFERLQIGNKVGTMLMDGKTYLAFDELMLYIGTGKKDLQKYGIQKVSSID